MSALRCEAATLAGHRCRWAAVVKWHQGAKRSPGLPGPGVLVCHQHLQVAYRARLVRFTEGRP